MIFDSHAHYSRKKYDTERIVWRSDGDGFAAERFSRESLIGSMRKEGIIGIIEPSVEFENIPAMLALAENYPGYIHTAIGVHPTRCFLTKWKNRKKLESYLCEKSVVAVGETGLDYHYPRKKQHRFVQKRWFRYQIKLAHKFGLPLVLHIRDADRDALKILKNHRSMLHGGTVHCFNGGADAAKEYIALGFTLGIGGAILSDGERGEQLRRAVAQVPLSSLLLETDAPYVSPEKAGEELSRKQRSKVLNSSLILPSVAQKIAEIRGIPAEETENATAENVLRTYGLSVENL